MQQMQEGLRLLEPDKPEQRWPGWPKCEQLGSGMKPVDDPRSKARECLWRAISAADTNEILKHLREAELWFTYAQKAEGQRPSGEGETKH